MEQKTKKNILIAIGAIAAGILIAFAIWAFIFLSQFSLYRDATYHFSIKYPHKWNVSVKPEGGAAVAFVSPRETALDTVLENVNISITDVPPHLASLKKFSDKIILQMTAVFKDIKATDVKEIEFGGRKGYRVEFTSDEARIKILSVWTIKGASKAYILTYLAASNRYKTYGPLVEFMVKSFTLQ